MSNTVGPCAIIKNNTVFHLVFWDGQQYHPNIVGENDIVKPLLIEQMPENPDMSIFRIAHRYVVYPDKVVQEYYTEYLASAQQTIQERIDSLAERHREKSMVLTTGQSMEYDQKLEEATKILSLSDPSTAQLIDYPMLAATEVAINGHTLESAAKTVVAAKVKSQQQLIAVATVRTRIKKRLSLAKTMDDKYQIYKKLNFTNELNQVLTQLQQGD